jgi:hypothetical protein
MLYSIDTSSLINGQRDLLPPTVFTSFWDNLEAMIEAGVVRAVDQVREELARKDDAVTAWAEARPALFVPLDEQVLAATKAILAVHPKLTGVGKGRNGADPFVIALALVHGGTVVTEEHPTGRIEKPKIPDVCEALGVPWTNLVGFAREQEWRF